MSRGRNSAGVVWWALILVTGASLIVSAVLLGPHRAMHIAAASFLSTTVDGLSEDPGPHRLREIDIEVDPAYLDTLETDLPWSGGTRFPATLIEHGVRHPVRFRYRGMYSASHFLGEKRSFRLFLKKKSPFAPYRKLNVINPKSFNMVNNHLGTWIAGRMGVAVPWNDMVFVRINGEDEGVMELYEQIDGDFEKVRGLTKKEVPVYKGDYPPITDRTFPPKRSLWRSAANWEYVSDADSTRSHERLRALVDVIDDSTMTLQDRRDTLGTLIDVDAYARYLAAMLVVNTKHMDQFHNQWLVMNERTGLFYPIFWDALLMFPPAGEPLYFINDALAHWFLRIPEWRTLRDRYAYQALQDLHVNGAFMAEYDRTIDRIQASVLLDRNKFGHVTLTPSDVHRFSVVHVISSFAGMRATVNTYWGRLNQRLEKNEVTQREGASLAIRVDSEAPVELRWSGATAPVPIIQVSGDTLMPVRKEGVWSLVLHHDVRLPEGSWDRPFANWQHYEALPIDVEVLFPYGVPLDLRMFNAITDAEIK